MPVSSIVITRESPEPAGGSRVRGPVRGLNNEQVRDFGSLRAGGARSLARPSWRAEVVPAGRGEGAGDPAREGLQRSADRDRAEAREETAAGRVGVLHQRSWRRWHSAKPNDGGGRLRSRRMVQQENLLSARSVWFAAGPFRLAASPRSTFPAFGGAGLPQNKKPGVSTGPFAYFPNQSLLLQLALVAFRGGLRRGGRRRRGGSARVLGHHGLAGVDE